MKKERIKSFILILLILNSINLTVQMWFDSGFWTSGDFLEMLKETPVIGKIVSHFDKEDEPDIGPQLYDKTMKPRRVVINGSGARELYLKESEYYNEAMQYVDVIMSDIKSKDVEIGEMSYEEWKNLFKSKSIYVDYGYEMDFENLNRMYGMSSSSGKFRQASEFTGFIIVPNVADGICEICMLNESNNMVVRHRFSADVAAMYNFIEQSTYQKQQNYTFAFEINLDILTSAEDEVERKVAFSPLTLLTIPMGTESDVVLKNNGTFKSYEEFERFAERTLRIFGYNASSLRKNVKSDGTITFVENNATVSFYYDGTIEYSAVSKENGLRLSNGNATSYQAIHDTLNVTEKLWDEYGINTENLDYQLVSPLSDDKEGKYTVILDNMYKGTTINYSSVTGNAVVAEVEDGYITKLVMHLSNISETDKKTESAPVLMAIDSVYAGYGKESMIIDDLYKCYDFDENGIGTAKWVFKLRDDSNILLIDTSDLYLKEMMKWNGEE